MSQTAIEVFYDLASPYSYLAVTQLDALRADVGRPVVARAFLLGGVFKAVGNEAPARVVAKARWMLSDLHRWAEGYGVPFTMNGRFPFNSLRPMRMLVALEGTDPEGAERLARSLFRRLWGEDQDPYAMETYTEALAEVGLAGRAAELLAAADDPAVKERLKEVTAEAVDRGAFGAPAIFVGDDLYWGNDRLEMVRQRLASKG